MGFGAAETTLAAVLQLAEVAVVAGKRKLVIVLATLWMLLYLAAKEEHVTSPRYYYMQPDYALISFWDVTRARRRDGAYMQFLGVPCFMFDMIYKGMEPLIPKWVRRPDAPATRGRPSVFDTIDVVAIALRRTQISATDSMAVLCSDVSRNAGTMAPYLKVSWDRNS